MVLSLRCALGSVDLREVELHGKPHHVMQADLDFYPPFQQPEVGFLSLPKLAA